VSGGTRSLCPALTTTLAYAKLTYKQAQDTHSVILVEDKLFTVVPTRVAITFTLP